MNSFECKLGNLKVDSVILSEKDENCYDRNIILLVHYTYLKPNVLNSKGDQIYKRFTCLISLNCKNYFYYYSMIHTQMSETTLFVEACMSEKLGHITKTRLFKYTENFTSKT